MANDSIASPGPLARLSLNRKLPLIMAALLALVVVTIAGASYAEVRATSTRMAADRLVSLVSQFRETFQNSGAQLRTQATSTAAKASLATFARTRRTRDRARALADLKYTGPGPEQVRAVELRDARGRVLLSTAPRAGFDGLGVADVLPSAEPGDQRGTIGRFRVLRDTIVYAVAAPVKGANVYVVQWRRVAGTRRGREAITNLMGSQAAMYLGTTGEEPWTNLESPVPAPRFTATPSATPATQTYRRGGKPYFAATATITGTPWTVAVDVPMAQVMAQADDFIQRVTLLALAALAIALVVAHVIMRRITAPLVQLTDAASFIAGGDFSHPVKIDRADELGRLGRAFGAMAHEVKTTRDNLERRVDERTRDLNDTLQQLHDAQDSLVRKEKLALLGQLASGVGHELRNPLGVMTNSVYYLKMVLDGQSKDVHEYLDMLSQQITLSEKLVSDLLDFARSRPPVRKPTSLAEVANAQVARLGPHEGVTLESDVNGKLPPVLVDPVQLGQVIFNMLTNAMQAVEASGVIRTRARLQGETYIYEVEDSGPGVPPENFEKVFEPLYTTRARGIGLGLAVSRTLARANGGDLTVSNASGGGAVFKLTLPVAIAAAVGVPA